MMIATVGLMAMAGLMAVTLRMQQLGRNSTSAARLVQDKIDELNTVGFNSALMACGGSLTADVANHNDRPAVQTDYKRRWTVGPGPDGTGTPQARALRAVTVRIIPDVRDSRVVIQQFELQTVIRWSGLNPVACP